MELISLHQILLPFFRNGVAATRTQAKKILWNYPDALTWSNSTTAIYGSVLAPFATANGNAESHNELFIGELPDPTVCLLSTSSTTSSTTTTTTTAAPLPRSPRCQAISDLLESVALQQAALSHILKTLRGKSCKGS